MCLDVVVLEEPIVSRMHVQCYLVFKGPLSRYQGEKPLVLAGKQRGDLCTEASSSFAGGADPQQKQFEVTAAGLLP